MTISTPTPLLANTAAATTSNVPVFAQSAIKTNSASDTPKRNQVKNACTNCQKACKKCDDARPCPRCEKYGIAETCVNSVRKERKKGIKRGPYKRRQKPTDLQNLESPLPPQQQQQQQQQPVQQQSVQQQSVQQQPSQVFQTPAVSTATSVGGTTAATNDFGYPSQLSQYAQPGYDNYTYAVNAAAAVYSSAAGSNKDILPGQYVLPVYSAYPAPVLVNGDTTTTTTTTATTTNSDNPVKSESVKIQPLTPVPSSSNSSGTTSPSEIHEEDEKFARLSQLCTAALRENKEASDRAAQELVNQVHASASKKLK